MDSFEAKMQEYALERKSQNESDSGKPKKVLLEATPGYLFNPLVAERMGRVLPEAKLLVV